MIKYCFTFELTVNFSPKSCLNDHVGSLNFIKVTI